MLKINVVDIVEIVAKKMADKLSKWTNFAHVD